MQSAKGSDDVTWMDLSQKVESLATTSARLADGIPRLDVHVQHKSPSAQWYGQHVWADRHPALSLLLL
jgi:hypothetical protein